MILLTPLAPLGVQTRPDESLSSMVMDLRPAQLGKLLDQWRDQADRLRRYGAAASAAAVEACAQDLEAWLDAWADALLTPQEAAVETGLKPETVSKKIASGELPNAGRRYRMGNASTFFRQTANSWFAWRTTSNSPMASSARRTAKHFM